MTRQTERNPNINALFDEKTGEIFIRADDLTYAELRELKQILMLGGVPADAINIKPKKTGDTRNR